MEHAQCLEWTVFPFSFMKRKAFALLEVLLVVGIVTTVGMFGVPLWQQYQFRGDLDIAKKQIVQGLQYARANAMAGKADSAWTFAIAPGALFAGDEYSSEILDDPNTEVYTMPQTVAFTGLPKVTYGKNGLPKETGTITLRAFNNEIDTIQIEISISQGSVDTTIGGSLAICYNGSTLSITDSAWPSYQSRGATMGACPGGGSSAAASSATSSAASSASSSGGSGSTGNSGATGGTGGTGGGGYWGGGSDPCASKFTLANNVITLTANSSVKFTNIAALHQLLPGVYINTHACYSKNNGSSYKSLFSGNGSCSGNGNAYGNALEVNGGDTKTLSLSTGDQLVVKARSHFQVLGWLAINNFHNTKDHPSRMIFMRNGDNPSNAPGAWSQTSLTSLLQSRGYLTSGVLNMDSCKLVLASEFDTEPGDHNDFVMELYFQ